jgi:hypothetical protein
METQKTRVDFLQASARTLFLSSPSTSRHLSLQGLELADLQTPSGVFKSSEACSACGNLLTPGWTTRSKTITRVLKRRQVTTPEREPTRRKTISKQCQVCHRTSRQTKILQLDTRKRQSRPTEASRKPIEEPIQDQPAVEKSSKVSNKKRAKSRKDREGLQALLNKSTQNKASPGLNLMDLMKR